MHILIMSRRATTKSTGFTTLPPSLEIRGQSSTRTETKGQKKVVDVKLVFHLVAYIRNSGKTNGGMVAFVHVNANFPENGLPKVLLDNLFGG